VAAGWFGSEVGDSAVAEVLVLGAWGAWEA